MPALFANSMKIAWRQIRRHQGYSVLNIAGLALGMACVLLIILYVRHEMSFDRYHPGADRISRVAVTGDIKGFGDLAITPSLLAAALKAELPEIESSTSLRCWGEWLIRTENAAFKETRVLFADPGIFDVFSFPLVAGNPPETLAEPNTLFMSESTAKKIFGPEDPLQKTVTLSRANVDGAGEVKSLYRIVGIFRDPPSTSYFRPGLIGALPKADPANPPEWDQSNSMTFFKSKKGTNARDLQSKIQALFDAHRYGELEASLGRAEAASRWKELQAPIYLQPLTSLHLRSHIAGDLKSNGNILYVAVFSAIAGLILVLACVNFINLSTARAGTRAREVGIRKVAGSTRARLVRQFLIETAVMTLLAFALALALAGFALPLFNNLTGLNLSWRTMADFGFLSLVLAALALVSVLAGLYPAFVLSSALPADVLKGRLRQGARGRGLRKGLVVFQFTISLVLMIGALLIAKQLRYIREANPGFDKEQVLLVHNVSSLGPQAGAFKQELLRGPNVRSVTLTSNPPVVPEAVGVVGGLRLEGQADASKSVTIHIMFADEDYIRTMGMEIVQGRDFSGTRAADSTAVIINERAVKAFGLKDPLDGRFSMRLHNGNERAPQPTRFTVIGVVRDFHFASLRREIDPLVIFLRPRPVFAAARLSAGDPGGTIEYVRRTWNKFAPDRPLEYSFMDEVYDGLYRAEQMTGRVLNIFTFLAVVIACLGLFGLAAFLAEQRTKEIGIRKVLGASVLESAGLLIKEFVILVGGANLLAVPIAYVLMSKWLKGFAYRTNMGPGLFIVAGLISLAVAVATVAGQAIKAALADPVKSLKYE
jgi:putative ABC transport system permease protein